MKHHIFIFIPLFLAGLALSFMLNSLKDATGGPAHTNDDPCAFRIISTVPSGTELIYALGCEQRLAGVTDFCQYPPAARVLPKIGGLFNPNFERLLALEPDAIIAQGRAPKMTAFCQQHGIRLLRIRMNTVDIILEDTRLLGEQLGCTDRAMHLARDMEEQLATIRAAVADRKRVRIFFSLYRLGGSTAGISTVGRPSFITDLIDTAGGENIFADIEQPYPKISLESLLKRRPEVIIEPFPGDKLDPADRQQRLQAWQSMSDLPAVAKGRIYFLPENLILKPGPRIVQTAKLLARTLHPDTCEGE